MPSFLTWPVIRDFFTGLWKVLSAGFLIEATREHEKLKDANNELEAIDDAQKIREEVAADYAAGKRPDGVSQFDR